MSRSGQENQEACLALAFRAVGVEGTELEVKRILTGWVSWLPCTLSLTCTLESTTEYRNAAFQDSAVHAHYGHSTRYLKLQARQACINTRQRVARNSTKAGVGLGLRRHGLQLWVSGLAFNFRVSGPSAKLLKFLRVVLKGLKLRGLGFEVEADPSKPFSA